MNSSVCRRYCVVLAVLVVFLVSFLSVPFLGFLQSVSARSEISRVPIVSDPYPTDGQINVPISAFPLIFNLSDPDGDLMDYYVTTNPSIGVDSNTGVVDGAYGVWVSGLTYSTTYTWCVNVSDGVAWISEAYTFTTEPDPFLPAPPLISDPYPLDGATDVSLLLSELTVTISDQNGDVMNMTGTTVPNIGSSEGLKIPDTSFTIPVSGLAPDTTYTWHVNVTDGAFWNNMTFTFTTMSMELQLFDASASELENMSHLVVRGLDNGIYYRSYDHLGSSWGDWTGLPGSTPDSPAAVVSGDELHLVVRAMDGITLYHGYVNLADDSFSGWTWMSGTTLSPPTLVSNETHLTLIVRGIDNCVYYRTYGVESRVWNNWKALPSGQTCDGISAIMIGNVLHFVVRGYSETEASVNKTLWQGSVNLDTDVFSGWTLMPGSTTSSPTLALWGTAFVLAVRGEDNSIYINKYVGSVWQGWNALPTGSTPESPAATVIGDELQVVVVGMGGVTPWNSLLNLNTDVFSGWTWLSGATPSKPVLTSSHASPPGPSPPTVVSTVPLNGATGVSVNTAVVVNFSEPMNQAATQGAFSIAPSVSGVFSWDNSSALRFTPTASLAYSTVYAVTISTAARDMQDENMEASYIWSFTTETGVDLPYVVNWPIPGWGATNVSVNTVVRINFSEPMNTTVTQGAFSISPSVAGSFAWTSGDTVMTFTPISALAYCTVYAVTISTAAKDKEGENMATPYKWSFATVATSGTTKPFVVSTWPSVGQTGVSNATTVQVTFNEAMDRNSTQAAFSIDGSIGGTFGWNSANTTLTFTPGPNNLTLSTVYHVTVSTSARDMQGENMTAVYAYSFITVASSTSPYITAITPGRSAENVGLVDNIRITFSEAVDHASAENSFSISPSLELAGDPKFLTWSGNQLRFNNTGLATGTTYTVTMSTGIVDLSDEHMEVNFTWTFTTIPPSPPYVVSTVPIPGETNVNYTILAVNFSEPMSASVTWAAFSISPFSTTSSYNNSRWVNSSYVQFYFAPFTNVTTYTVTISTNARDAKGENMTAFYSWTFTVIYHGSFDSSNWGSSGHSVSGLGTGESSPLIGDVTSDVGEEVIYVGGDTGASSGAVLCLSGVDGHEIWRYTDTSIGWNVQPQMGDIDNDGQFEIVVPLYSPTGILVLDTDNSTTGEPARSLKWKRTGIGGSSYTSKPLVVDPDGDGFWQIFCAPEDVRGYGYTNTYTGRIWSFNFDGREMKNGLQGTAGGTRTATGGTSGSYYQWFAWRPCSGGFVMADTDNNGLFELYQNDRDMYYGDGDYGKGTICWEWNATSMTLSLKWYQPDMLVSSHTPILVDVNKDGVLDVVAAHMRGGLAIFNSTTGTEIKKDYNIGLPSHYQPVVYDIDRDGNLEILLADGDHPGNSPPDIVVFDLYKWVTGANTADCIDARMYVGPCKFPPAVGEVTGDGIMDMIAVSDKGIFVFDGSHDPSIDKTYPICVVANTNNYQNMYAVIQDIDADGLNEIVVTSSGYRVYAYNTLGIPPTPRPRSEVQYYNERRTGVAEYVPPIFLDRTAPILSNPYPSNEAANVPVNLQRLNFTLADLQSDKMNCTVTTTIPVDPGNLTGLNVDGGTYVINLTSNLQYHTKYYWTVRVTDGVHWNNKTYTFTTPDGTPPGNAPTQGFPLLASTGIGEYENATSVNLVCTNQTTADLDNDKVTNIYRWLRDNQSIANLILPFDTDNLTTAKDYSGYNSNAQIHGATWTSNGKVGGAYSFDGLDDYMTISDGGVGYYNGRIYSSSLGGGGNSGNWSEMTVEMWINLAALSSKESTRILMKVPSYEIGLGSIGGSGGTNNRLEAAVWLDNPDSGDNAGPPNSDPKASEYWSVSAPTSTPLSINTWYHVAFTYKDGGGTDYSVLTLYINGVAVTSSSSLTTRGPIKASSGEPIYIGWFDYFEGMIDEVRIYSRSLSAEQISQRYNETKDGLTNSSTLSHKETLTGESWTCQITPNDSHQDGTARTSNPLTILPGPQVAPTAGNVRVLDAVTLSTSRLLSNNSAIVIYDYFDENDDPEIFGGSFGTQIRWYENGTYMPAWDNLLSLSNTTTTSHLDYNCTVTPGDGYAVGNVSASTNKVIRNSPPEVTDYSPEYGYSLDHLTFTVGQSQTFSFECDDLDGDNLTIYWQVGSVNATEQVTYTTLPATSSFTWTAPALGSYTVRARISDTGYGSTSVTQSWSIVVR